MRKSKKEERNITGSVLGVIAVIITYIVITRDSKGHIVTNIEPDWIIGLIPLSGVIVFLLFQYVIKKDFLKKYK